MFVFRLLVTALAKSFSVHITCLAICAIDKIRRGWYGISIPASPFQWEIYQNGHRLLRVYEITVTLDARERHDQISNAIESIDFVLYLLDLDNNIQRATLQNRDLRVQALITIENKVTNNENGIKSHVANITHDTHYTSLFVRASEFMRIPYTRQRRHLPNHTPAHR